jgi:hypothetical protein
MVEGDAEESQLLREDETEQKKGRQYLLYWNGRTSVVYG